MEETDKLPLPPKPFLASNLGNFPPFLSDVNASSELGVDGIIEINRLNVEPIEGLTNLPETKADVEVAQGCEAAGEGSVAFYDLGRGGLPAQPEDFIRIKTIPWIPLTIETETEPESWRLIETTYSVFPATTPIQFKFSVKNFKVIALYRI